MPLRRSATLTPDSLAAHQANARKSRGPRTPRGRACVSFNAFKHGRFAARAPLLRQRLLAAGFEDEEERYGRIRSRIAQTFGGTDPHSRRQVDRLAASVWYCFAQLRLSGTIRECAVESRGKQSRLLARSLNWMVEEALALADPDGSDLADPQVLDLDPLDQSAGLWTAWPEIARNSPAGRPVVGHPDHPDLANPDEPQLGAMDLNARRGTAGPGLTPLGRPEGRPCTGPTVGPGLAPASPARPPGAGDGESPGAGSPGSAESTATDPAGTPTADRVATATGRGSAGGTQDPAAARRRHLRTQLEVLVDSICERSRTAPQTRFQIHDGYHRVGLVFWVQARRWWTRARMNRVALGLEPAQTFFPEVRYERGLRSKVHRLRYPCFDDRLRYGLDRNAVCHPDRIAWGRRFLREFGSFKLGPIWQYAEGAGDSEGKEGAGDSEAKK